MESETSNRQIGATSDVIMLLAILDEVLMLSYSRVWPMYSSFDQSGLFRLQALHLSSLAMQLKGAQSNHSRSSSPLARTMPGRIFFCGYFIIQTHSMCDVLAIYHTVTNAR